MQAGVKNKAGLPQGGGARAQACWDPWQRCSPPPPSCRAQERAALKCALLALPETSTDKHQIRKEQWQRTKQAKHHPNATVERDLWPAYWKHQFPIKTHTHTHQSSLSRSPEVDGFESHGGRVDRGCSLNDGWCWFDGREGPLYCRRVWHHGDHFWDLQEHIHRQFTHNREAQTDQVRTSEQPPEVQQPCAGWAEGPAEALGPVRAEGAPWEAEEEAEVEEALLEVHASSAASDQLQNNPGIKSHHHCLPEFEV